MGQVNGVEALADHADFVIDTSTCSEPDVVVRVAAHLGLLGSRHSASVDVLVGGQYGSEGKGQIAGFIAPEYDVLMRVGGPNAGHKVFGDSGSVITHRSLPSGTTKNSEALLIIGPGAVIDEKVLMQEIADSGGVEQNRLKIDPQAFLITENDVSDETELVKNIGSTGKGVGQAAARRITARGAPGKPTMAKYSETLAPFISETREELDRAYRQG